MEETKTDTNVIEETNSDTIMMTLRERQSAKFEEFINQYVIGFLGQSFITNRLKPNHIKHENRLYVQQQIMPRLSAVLYDCKKIQNDNADDVVNDILYEYLTIHSSLIDICREVPIITEIIDAICIDDISNKFFDEKLKNMDFNANYITLINELVSMV
jgi:hypothetical protein